MRRSHERTFRVTKHACFFLKHVFAFVFCVVCGCFLFRHCDNDEKPYIVACGKEEDPEEVDIVAEEEEDPEEVDIVAEEEGYHMEHNDQELHL